MLALPQLARRYPPTLLAADRAAHPFPPPPPPHAQTPKLGLIQIFIFIGFIEVLGILNSRRADYEPGNFLGSAQWETDETWESYQLKELNNGRLAMFASIGMLTHAYITGKGPLELLDTTATVVF